ncbi:OmpA family protein [Azospirillum picis]|uniref:Outer membrane protein OmpA-like peptidoglycan-associated protein n=1 Tax=Azospirillum picis TaxID=488438 RepID=A0ABU0MQ44_9PROT|nr:OmpA family protein [Azospirillum picis]MBP2302114.1 outer membrane protein OmpA-like peptidoglycan-associated protein [Azospirillum picis]MDQ0535595.1 outer membrane protein OmpA-like peptidoglycan-associated protein [Azospirillum picis]
MTRSALPSAVPFVLPITVAALLCALPAAAQTVEGSGASRVMMFDRPPSVDELRGLVAPDAGGQKIRTRSIEIVGGAADAAARRPRPVDEVNYALPPSSAPATPAVTPAAASPAAPQSASSRQAPDRTAARRHREAPPAPPAAAQEAAVPAEQAAVEHAVTEQDPAPQAFGFRINFAFNSADIPADSAGYIDAVGKLMAEDGGLALTVQGHTDATGSLAYNMLLSQRRAVAVGEYLVRVHHIDPGRITVDGRGPTAPLAADPYDSRNRRVEFKPSR